MGEALISRAGGGSEADVVIPVTPGYHTVLVTLKDYENKALNGFNLNCKDGSTYYNYSTNDKGQVLFTCNSGSANIFLPNGNYIDFQSSWTNVAAPIGLTSKVNINMQKSNFVDVTTNRQVMFLKSTPLDLYVIGAGAGGGSGEWSFDDDSDYIVTGQGGGSGYMNRWNNISFNSNTVYQVYVGAGGSGGYSGSASHVLGAIGGSGGTTYIANTSYSAIGGSGGSHGRDPIGGSGGLGAGGNGYEEYEHIAKGDPGGASPINFAGGGGGAGLAAGGYPYGGSGGSSIGATGGSGSRGGGGGGGVGSGSYGRYSRGGSGGNGLIRFDFK